MAEKLDGSDIRKVISVSVYVHSTGGNLLLEKEPEQLVEDVVTSGANVEEEEGAGTAVVGIDDWLAA